MNLLQVKTSLRAGYAQIQASAQTFRLERLTPLVNETQEFVEDVREGYVQTRNTIHTVGHETLPVWWNTTRRESHAAVHTIQEELIISVTTPFKQRVRNVTTQVREAFQQVGPLLDEVYEAGERVVLTHLVSQGGKARRRQFADLIADDAPSGKHFASGRK